VEAKSLKLKPGQSIEINLEDFSDSATIFEYSGTPVCKVININDGLPYNHFSTCTITKDPNTFQAVLLAGNFSASASSSYSTNTDGYSYG